MTDALSVRTFTGVYEPQFTINLGTVWDLTTRGPAKIAMVLTISDAKEFDLLSPHEFKNDGP